MLQPRDQAYLDTITDDGLRTVMSCALETYRMPDAVHPGDELPDLTLTRVAAADESLHIVGEQALRTPRTVPLVLIFGSFT